MSPLCAGSRRRRPCPAGSGARGWRRICSPDLFLSPPRRNRSRLRRGFVFQKTEYWDQLPSLSSESKREDATARFLRRGFPYGLSRGILCSAYTRRYPIPASQLPALRSPATSVRNVRNAAQNVVRVEPGRIAVHYTRHFLDEPMGSEHAELPADSRGTPTLIRLRLGFASVERLLKVAVAEAVD